MIRLRSKVDDKVREVIVIESHEQESLLVKYVDDQVSASERELAEELIRTDGSAAEFLKQLEQTRASFGDTLLQPLQPASEASISLINDWQPVATNSNSKKKFGLMAICASLAAGFFAGHLLTAATNFGSGLYEKTKVVEVETPEWIRLIADYHLLYVQETVADATVLPIEQVSSNVSSWLARETNIPLLSEQDIHFKRAQQLSIEGDVLVQLAYLPDKDKPVAVCIRKTSTSRNTDVSYSHHGEMDYAVWQDGHHSVVVVGEIEPTELKVIAEKVRSSLFDV